jgi:hypothetical protein
MAGTLAVSTADLPVTIVAFRIVVFHNEKAGGQAAGFDDWNAVQ